MHYCIDSCIPILNENCNIFVIYTVFFTRLFSTFENDDFFMVTAPTVVPAYKATMQCTNEQLCYNFNFNLFLLKLST